jgi:lysophospholipase L1-like esterase
MRICFFGESYVNGTGDPTYQGWVGRLCERARTRGYDLTAYNCGVRGATSNLIARTWKHEADARLSGIDKAAVVFSFGTNDSWLENGQPRVTAEQQIRNTRQVLSEASSDWPVLMIGPPGLAAYADNTLREADHRTRCASVAAACRELSIPYFDTLAVFGAFKSWRTEALAHDGAHPGSGGYAEMAEAIDAWPPWRALLDQLK